MSLFKKYRVEYNTGTDSFLGARTRYRAGRRVVMYFKKECIGTDTDYMFKLDGERLNAMYNRGLGYKICFKMPAHDVKLEVYAVNSMNVAERGD
jgi:hypothetical protein